MNKNDVYDLDNLEFHFLSKNCNLQCIENKWNFLIPEKDRSQMRLP